MVRILLIMRLEFFRTHLATRAAALTFAILLSLVPILALTTSILKGLGNDEQLRQAAVRFIDQLEGPVLATSSREDEKHPSLPIATDQTVPSPPAKVATEHLHRAVDIVFQYVERTNFAALGLVGILGLIVVVLLVLASIEEAMNVIWHTRKGRPLLRKIMDYLALLILLPLSLNVALAAEAILVSETIMHRLAALLPSPWMAPLVLKLVPFACIILTLTTMYLFFPHVKVRKSAALIGAVFASVFWFIVQKLYIALQVGVANYNAIYGSFASIPLFLVWLQIGWTFILLGASLAYAIQNHRNYHVTHGMPRPQHLLQIAYDALDVIYERFALRSPITLSLLCDRLPHYQRTDIHTVVRQLVAGGLLGALVQTDEKKLLPITPADKLDAGEVVRLFLGGETVPTVGGLLAAKAVEAAIRSTTGITLHQLHDLTDKHEPVPVPNHSSTPGQHEPPSCRC